MGYIQYKDHLCRRKGYQIKYIEYICSRFDQIRSMVSHIEVRLPNKPPRPNTIGWGLSGPQRQLWKEALFVQYYNNKNVSLLSAPTPIKYLPEGKKVLHSLIAPSIKEGDFSDAWKFVAHHCANGSYKIKSVYFYQSYIPVAHADSFKINIDITSTHRLTVRILDVSNAFQNTDVTIHEIFCVSPPPYYIYWFERSYPNVPLNWYDGPFFL